MSQGYLQFLRALVAVALLGTLSPASAMASALDDCILANTLTARGEPAVVALRRACLHKADQPLDAKALNKISAEAVYISDFDGPVLRLNLHNGTGYEITQLVVRVQNKKTGAIRDYIQSEFYLPFGEDSDPVRFLSIKNGEQRDFCVRIGDKVPDEDFWNLFSWSLMSAKGVQASALQSTSTANDIKYGPVKFTGGDLERECQAGTVVCYRALITTFDVLVAAADTPGALCVRTTTADEMQSRFVSYAARHHEEISLMNAGTVLYRMFYDQFQCARKATP